MADSLTRSSWSMSSPIRWWSGAGNLAMAGPRHRSVTPNLWRAFGLGSMAALPVRTEGGGIMKIDFTLNGSPASLDCEPEKPLLWVLREDLHLTGAKYGCGIAQCGCCTVHVDGDAVRSCVTPVQRV